MIDVEEVICELHRIAGTENVDADIRRTACEAESALAILREWVNQLQMTMEERKAVEWFAEDFPGRGRGDRRNAETLRSFLKRLGGKDEQQRAEIDRLKEAIRRLADQDATLSVSGGNVIVEMDFTLTDEERKAVEWYAAYGAGRHAATLRTMLGRLGGND